MIQTHPDRKPESWPIQRYWKIEPASGNPSPSPLATDQLDQYGACILLAPAGMGKTHEINRLAERESTRAIRLVELAQDPGGLRTELKEMAEALPDGGTLALDALDELLILSPVVGLTLANGIRECLDPNRHKLRVACRPTVFPDEVRRAILEKYPENHVIARLEPLDDHDLEEIAQSMKLDPDDFLNRLRQRRALELARSPFTLNELLRLYKENKELIRSRNELLNSSVNRLLAERKERRDVGAVPKIPFPTLVKAAEKLACFLVLAKRDSIDLNDEPGEHGLNHWKIYNQLKIEPDVLSAICQSGLCRDDGIPGTFQFVHRQYLEYLAGRRIAELPIFNVKTILRNDRGIQGHLRETAAFAAMEKPEIAEWIAEFDPEIIALSEVSNQDLRRKATRKLIEKFRNRELTGSMIVRQEIPLANLGYENLEDDLGEPLRQRGPEAEDLLVFAVELVKACRHAPLYPALVDLALDPTAHRASRFRAAAFIFDNDDEELKSRLKPLIFDSESDDSFDLKGLALMSLWPDRLNLEELLQALEARQPRSIVGYYSCFLRQLAENGFDAAENRVLGLEWATRVIRDWEQWSILDPDDDDRLPIVRNIVRSARDETAKPETAAALNEFIRANAKSQCLEIFNETLSIASIFHPIPGSPPTRDALRMANRPKRASQAPTGRPSSESERHRPFLEGIPDEWWNDRCPELFREELNNLDSNHASDATAERLRLFCRRAPRVVRDQLLELARTAEPKEHVDHWPRLAKGVHIPDLDRELLNALERNELPPASISPVIQFLYEHDQSEVLALAKRTLTDPAPATDLSENHPANKIAEALLEIQSDPAWSLLIDFLEANPESVRPVIESFPIDSTAPHLRSWTRESDVSTETLGRLLILLFEHFPPRDAPTHIEPYWGNPPDSARIFRDRVLSVLECRPTSEAIEILEDLHRRFGSENPWLHRPLSDAKRRSRLADQPPLPLSMIVDLLNSDDKRLIRFDAEVVEGILHALEQFEKGLRGHGPSLIEDLWNIHPESGPSPKPEEHMSDKVKIAIESVFEQFAVTVDREVQIHRRKLSKTRGGEPGSELDVFVKVPACGATSNTPVVIPIEVKRSNNPEAKTALREQLANRYMPQSGAKCAVYILFWLSARQLEKSKKPVWSDIEEAKADLERQASEIRRESGLRIAVRVIDATIR